MNEFTTSMLPERDEKKMEKQQTGLPDYCRECEKGISHTHCGTCDKRVCICPEKEEKVICETGCVGHMEEFRVVKYVSVPATNLRKNVEPVKTAIKTTATATR